MKTPREILFERHRHAEPRLDAVRRNALAALPGAPTCSRLKTSRPQRGVHWLSRALSRLQVGAPALLRQVWLGLIWPSRRAWAGMAVLWLAVLAVNLEMKASSPAAPAARSAHGREWAQAVEAQRRLLAELLPSAPPPAVQPPRSSPSPRSERTVPFKAC